LPSVACYVAPVPFVVSATRPRHSRPALPECRRFEDPPASVRAAGARLRRRLVGMRFVAAPCQEERRIGQPPGAACRTIVARAASGLPRFGSQRLPGKEAIGVPGRTYVFAGFLAGKPLHSCHRRQSCNTSRSALSVAEAHTVGYAVGGAVLAQEMLFAYAQTAQQTLCNIADRKANRTADRTADGNPRTVRTSTLVPTIGSHGGNVVEGLTPAGERSRGAFTVHEPWRAPGNP
jgi:hypothetical protein